MKSAIYFPISTTHYSSTLSLNIRRTKGWQGYGQYIAILQMLANTKTRKLSLEEVPDIAFNLHISKQEVQNIINSYFLVDSQGFYSIELEEALSYFDAKYNAGSIGGKKAAASLTPEQRKDKAKKAADLRWNKLEEIPSDIDLVCQNMVNNDMLSTEHNANTLASEMLSTERNANNKIKENRIEEKRKEESQKKENKTKDQPSVSNFDVFSLQEEIRNYSSRFFKDFNLDYVTNYYVEFRKQYEHSKIPLSKFEQILFYLLHQFSLSYDDPNISVNDYLNKVQPTLLPYHIQDTVNFLNENQDMQDHFKKVVNNVLSN
jgi:hypothetical protein